LLIILSRFLKGSAEAFDKGYFQVKFQ
jgi:hypothetical protein